MDNGKRPLGPERRVTEEPVEHTVAGEEPPRSFATTATHQPDPKGRKTFRILTVLLVLALIGAGVLGYLWYVADDDRQAAESETATLRAENEQLRSSSETAGDGDTSMTAPVDDTTAIIDAAALYSRALVSATDDATFAIDQRTAEFALVFTTTVDSGYGMLLKKVNDTWIVIHAGQAIDQGVVDQFGVPDEFVAVPEEQ